MPNVHGFFIAAVPGSEGADDKSSHDYTVAILPKLVGKCCLFTQFLEAGGFYRRGMVIALAAALRITMPDGPRVPSTTLSEVMMAPSLRRPLDPLAALTSLCTTVTLLAGHSMHTAVVENVRERLRIYGSACRCRPARLLCR